MCILKADNISKTYYKTGEEISVLNGLSLFIKQGEILVLMGPSGSGKSTLLNILGTLDTEFTGSLVIDNVLINANIDLSFIRSNKLGFVFQFHHLLPEFTIYENLLIPGMISGKNNDRSQEIVEMLKLLGLQKRKNHYPNEISGGERQRIAVMRALVNSPSIVLADEPTGNLDSENSQLLLKLLVSLRSKYKQSFIIATHDKSVLDIADRVLYLKDGSINKDIES